MMLGMVCEIVLLATSSPSTRLSALPSDSVAQRSLPQVNALGGHGLGGFGRAVEYPAFYSYAYLEPLGFTRRRIGITAGSDRDYDVRPR